MPLARKTSTESALPDALKTQISNNFKKDDDFRKTVTPVVEVPAAESKAKSTAKSKYADSVNLRLTSGKRSEFKKFFTECEISMNQGFEMAVDYIIRETKAGRITISKSGISKVGEM